jgi:hypothetical protein
MINTTKTKQFTPKLSKNINISLLVLFVSFGVIGLVFGGLYDFNISKAFSSKDYNYFFTHSNQKTFG